MLDLNFKEFIDIIEYFYNIIFIMIVSFRYVEGINCCVVCSCRWCYFIFCCSICNYYIILKLLNFIFVGVGCFSSELNRIFFMYYLIVDVYE